MTVVAVGSVRSCAVTTTTVGLAMVWPGAERRVLIEVDPAGGTLAASAGLASEPGLVSLAAAARRQPEPGVVFEHAQRLAVGTAVVCGPPSADQARSTLSMLAALLARAGEVDGVLLADCGRLDTASTRLFGEADLSVLVCRPVVADLNALAAYVQNRPAGSARPLVVLVGSGPYPPGEISITLAVEVVGQLPWDPTSASLLAAGEAPSSRRLTRTGLVRELRSIAAGLAARINPAVPRQPVAVGPRDRVWVEAGR